jgi:alanyl aminopeptidase
MRGFAKSLALFVIAFTLVVSTLPTRAATTHASGTRAARSTSATATHTAKVPTSAASPDSAPPRLSKDAVPTFESVDLTLDPEKPDYHGNVVVLLTVAKPTNELRFHARAMTLDRATLEGPDGPIAVTSIQKLVPDQARLRLAKSLAPGAYKLWIEFHNLYNTRAVSLYKVVTGDHAYLFTQFEDTEAREAFPCWDEPEFKIPWSVSLQVPDADLAVGNTPIVARTNLGAMKRIEFKRTPPLPSYLIAIAVGPLETVPITGLSIPGNVITVQGATSMAAEAVRVTPGIVRSLEAYFGRPYPYEKLDLIAAPEFLYGAMENAGAIVFADRRLLIDPRSVSPAQRRSLIGVVAHEIAHQWFGDLVTMKWWDDLWLNESFASWMATKVEDDVVPEERNGVTTLFGIERAFTIDSRPSTSAMRGKIVGAMSLGQTANDLTYNKGEAVLTMFEGWLGRDAFRSGVLDYLKAHEWGNAEGRDLWHALGKTSGDDIDAAMSSFLDQPGVPLVTVEPLDGGRVRLRQSRFLTLPGEHQESLWRIPVILRYPARDGVKTRRAWLTQADTVVDLGVAETPAWIDPNAGASGYYRWSVPDPMIDALVSISDRALTSRERIDLIANLTAGLRAGRLHGDRYLQWIARLADDPSPEVTRAALEAINATRVPLTTPRDAAMFATFIQHTLTPALKRFGMEPAAGESLGVTLMRPLLLRMLAVAAHDTNVIAYAERLGRAYRNDPTTVPPSLVETGVVIGATRGDAATFEDYRKRFEATRVPSERTLYLAGLGSFADPTLRKQALDYALSGPLRPQEPLVIPSNMSFNSLGPEDRGALLYPDDVAQWMMDHFAELSAKTPPNFATRIMGLGAGCTPERLATLRAYFADPSHRVLGGDYTMKRMSDAFQECAGMNERESERVERWLEGVARAGP